MFTRRSTLAALAAATLARSALAQTDTIAKARQEGKLAIYTSTDQSQGVKLIDAFKARYPGIAVEWNDMGTTAVFNRIISEAAAKQVGGDIAWSSAIDLQMSVVDRNLAAEYKTPEAQHLPPWAIYKNTGYGTSIEPAAVIYNKRLLPEALVPHSHDDLLRLLRDERAKLDGKVCTYDPEKSGIGYMFASDGLAHYPKYWELAAAFGAAHGKVYGGSGTMREKVVSGEHLMAFDVIGSYAQDWARQDPNLGVTYLADHVPAFSRVMLICKGAPHPAAAALFLDYVLSPDGQRAMGEGGLAAIRTDVSGTENPDTLGKLVGGKVVPIALDEKLIAGLDPKRRAEFFRNWRKAMAG